MIKSTTRIIDEQDTEIDEQFENRVRPGLTPVNQDRVFEGNNTAIVVGLTLSQALVRIYLVNNYIIA